MAVTKDFEVVKQEVREMVAEIGEIDEAEIRDDASFTDDLGLDSMMALEIVAMIEKKYKIRIAEEEITKINSLENVFKLLENSLKISTPGLSN